MKKPGRVPGFGCCFSVLWVGVRRVQNFDFLMLPLGNRVGNQARFLMGIGGVMVRFLKLIQRVMNGFGLGLCVWHGNDPS